MFFVVRRIVRLPRWYRMKIPVLAQRCVVTAATWSQNKCRFHWRNPGCVVTVKL